MGDGAEVDPLDSGRLDWIWAGDLAERGYTAADLETTARVLGRPCPTCRADVGEWCHNTGSGAVLDDLDLQHIARRDLEP